MKRARSGEEVASGGDEQRDETLGEGATLRAQVAPEPPCAAGDRHKGTVIVRSLLRTGGGPRGPRAVCARSHGAGQPFHCVAFEPVAGHEQPERQSGLGAVAAEAPPDRRVGGRFRPAREPCVRGTRPAVEDQPGVPPQRHHDVRRGVRARRPGAPAAAPRARRRGDPRASSRPAPQVQSSLGDVASECDEVGAAIAGPHRLPIERLGHRGHRLRRRERVRAGGLARRPPARRVRDQRVRPSGPWRSTRSSSCRWSSPRPRTRRGCAACGRRPSPPRPGRGLRRPGGRTPRGPDRDAAPGARPPPGRSEPAVPRPGPRRRCALVPGSPGRSGRASAGRRARAGWSPGRSRPDPAGGGRGRRTRGS